MGKQWCLYKASTDASTCAKSSSSTSNKKTTKGKTRKKEGDKNISFGGCMSTIFHLFDMQHHHLPFHQPFISQPSTNIPQQPNVIVKGVEAPRNSLESEEQEPMVSSSSSSLKLKQEETNFNIPAMREIQIKTKRTRLTDDISSECSSSSPGSKTPNLVARLMGLDLLPENSSPRGSLSSPRVSSSSSHATPLSKLSSQKYNNNTRSLPVTPRVSTAPRQSNEFNYHHRLSLQVNKENKRRYYDESTSEYAKQIAKQVRENISRRVGADITNSAKRNEHRRDEFLVVLKPKKPSPPPSRSTGAATINKSRNLDQGNERGKENEPIPLSSSPRLRLLEISNNLNKPNSNSLKCSTLSSSLEGIKPPSSSTTNSSPRMKEEVQVAKPVKIQKCKRIASEKYDLRLKKQEEPIVKKCNKKSTPLTNHLVKVNNTTKFISFKKDITSPSSTTISPQKQVSSASITHLPSCQSRSYNSNGNGTSNIILKTITTSISSNSVSDYYKYISSILNHSGIEENTPISISHWYSPSHPLHPSIFQQLEKHSHPNFANRKLIFDVTNELLVEILKPYINLKPWALGQVTSQRMSGSQLIKTLCEKICCFPAVDCQVLEDIDMLIECDLRNSTRVVGTTAFEELAEEIVTEMERDMVDTLVNEMAVMILHVVC